MVDYFLQLFDVAKLLGVLILNSVVSVGIGGTIWLFFAERYKQSLTHKYNKDLEVHKKDQQEELKKLEQRFAKEMQAIRHSDEVFRLRTSLFFEPHRKAFAELLNHLIGTTRAWYKASYTEESGLESGISHHQFSSFQDKYHGHLLFLDSECTMALELVLEFYRDSFPEEDGQPPNSGILNKIGECVQFLEPLVTIIFQTKIGLSTDFRAAREIAMLGAIKTVNRYSFSAIGFPVTGNLKCAQNTSPAQMVEIARNHLPELLGKLQVLLQHLTTDDFQFSDVAERARRYLSVLGPSKKSLALDTTT